MGSSPVVDRSKHTAGTPCPKPCAARRSACRAVVPPHASVG